MPNQPRDICDGTLTVRRAEEGETHLISFCGELDLANAGTAEAELNEALEATGKEVVVDLRELEFIDSTGIALLVAALRRSDGSSRLRFVPDKSPAVARVLELTGIEEKLPLTESLPGA
jgi:anti-sigma B factor antagonist